MSIDTTPLLALARAYLAAVPPEGHPLEQAADGVSSAITEVADVPEWMAPDEALLASLAELTRAESRIASLRLAMLAEAEERGCAKARGAVSMAGWLTGVLGVRPGAAARQVALGQALRRHPAVHAALSEARINADAAEVIVDTLERIPVDADEQTHGRALSFLLEQTSSLDPRALARAGRHLLAVLDAGAGTDLAGSEERQVRTRELALVSDPTDGRLHLSGWLDAETGSMLRTALEPYAAPVPADDGRPDRRSTAQRNADALAELVRGALDGGGLPISGGERPHLTVTVPLALLRSGVQEARSRLGGVGVGETEWATPLSAGALRRIACDARVVPVVLGGASQPLDVGRAAYAVPGPMRRALVTRDKGCAFPGCDRPPAWCHAHHIEHWADGGETKIDNLVLLCGHHHRLIHGSGWQVAIDVDGMPMFTPPAWVDPAQVPRRSTWRQRLDDFASPGHDPPG